MRPISDLARVLFRFFEIVEDLKDFGGVETWEASLLFAPGILEL